MLSNYDIDLLVEKLNILDFRGCFYKDKISKIQPNSSFIINLNSNWMKMVIETLEAIEPV
jgi:hypothetical protein